MEIICKKLKLICFQVYWCGKWCCKTKHCFNRLQHNAVFIQSISLESNTKSIGGKGLIKFIKGENIKMGRVNQFQEGKTMFRGRKKKQLGLKMTKLWVQFSQMHNKSSNY